MSKKLFLVLLIVSIFFILSAVEGFAAVPQKINFQGRLLNITNPGAPTPEVGSRNVAFGIYNQETGGTQLWYSGITQWVSCDSQGQFSTTLDLGTASLDFSKPMWLRVEFPPGDSHAMAPRQPLETVPYAFYAVTAETVVGSAAAGGWVDAGAVVKLATITDNVGIGTTEPAAKLEVAGVGVYTQSIYSRALDSNGYARLGLRNPARNWSISCHPSGLFAIADETASSIRMVISTEGNVGIGTTTPNGKLMVKTQNTGGADGTAPLVLDRAYGEVGDYQDIVFGGGNGNAANRVGIIRSYANAAGETSLAFYTQTGAGDAVNHESMRILGNGNVGIGTATPDATLDVKGTVHMIGTSTDYSSTYNSDHIAPSDGFVVVYVTASSGSNNLTMIGWTKDGPIDSYTPICGANANGDPTECSYYGGFSMPVRKGQYWKVTKEFSYGEYYGFKVRYFPIGHE